MWKTTTRIPYLNRIRYTMIVDRGISAASYYKCEVHKIVWSSDTDFMNQNTPQMSDRRNLRGTNRSSENFYDTPTNFANFVFTWKLGFNQTYLEH